MQRQPIPGLYQMLASRTIPERDPKENLIGFCFGLIGESGEFIDHIKKHLYHGHEIDRSYVEKELGDILWYISGLATVLGLDLGTIARENIHKLVMRYPNGFSEGDSINRVDTENQSL